MQHGQGPAQQPLLLRPAKLKSAAFACILVHESVSGLEDADFAELSKTQSPTVAARAYHIIDAGCEVGRLNQLPNGEILDLQPRGGKCPQDLV